MASKKEQTIADRIAELQAEIAALEVAQKAEGAQEATNTYLAWLGTPSKDLRVEVLVEMLSPVAPETLNQAYLKINQGNRPKGGGGGTGVPRQPRLSLDEVAAKLPSGEFKLSDLAEAIDREPQTARNYLNKLVEAGTVGVIGDDPNHSGKGKAAKIYAKA